MLMVNEGRAGYLGMGCEDRGGQNILQYIIDRLGPFREIWEYARKLSGNSQGKNVPEYGNPLRSLSYSSIRCTNGGVRAAISIPDL